MPKKMVGQKILMGCRFLDRRVVTRNSLFIRQLTGKKQAFEKFIHWILGGMAILALFREISAKTTPNSLPRETGKEQGKNSLFLYLHFILKIV